MMIELFREILFLKKFLFVNVSRVLPDFEIIINNLELIIINAHMVILNAN